MCRRYSPDSCRFHTTVTVTEGPHNLLPALPMTLKQLREAEREAHERMLAEMVGVWPDDESVWP